MNEPRSISPLLSLGELRPRSRAVEMEPLLLGRREIRVEYPGRRPSSLGLTCPCPGLISIALPGHFVLDTENFGEDFPHKLRRARFSRMNQNTEVNNLLSVFSVNSAATQLKELL